MIQYNMKKLGYLLMAMPLLFTSCSSDEAVSEEAVEVSFHATLPQKALSRANSLNVNKVVCATFQNGEEIPALRQTINVVDGQNVVYSPRLLKGHSYQVAFWAMKDAAYNVTDMKNISVAASDYSGNPDVYECFTNSSDEFEVADNSSVAISLRRPMARINLGVTEADKNAVSALGYTLTKVQVSLQAAESYDALGKACSELVAKTMVTPVSEGVLSVNSVDYKALASYMVFTDGSNVTLEYTIYGKKGAGAEEALITRSIDNVPLGVNKNTNIVGDLMTGTVNYTITMESAYSEADNNQTL